MATRLAGLLAVLAVTSTAQAQFGFGAGSQRINRPLNRPTVSPYVNLLRGGGAGLNYYGLVRPEQQFGQALQQLQGGLGVQRGFGRANPAFGGSMGLTGHAVVFDSYRQQGGVGGGGGLGGIGFGGGGGGNFQPGFLNQGGGGFGGFGGGGNSSFSPINQGALNGGGAFAGGGAGGGGIAFGGGGGGGAVGGAALGGGGGGGGNFGGGNAGGGAGGAAGGRGTPWGVGVPTIRASALSRTGHPVVFDSYRQQGLGGQ